jgi:RNase P subunit RPR2
MIYRVFYTCPECSRKIKRDIDYPDRNQFVNPKNNELTISTWCPRCGAIHTYSISIKQKGKRPTISTHYFLCNEQKKAKRLKIEKNKES